MENPAVIEAPANHETPACEARLLRGATLILFQASDDPVRDRHWLCGPLSRAVASQRSREGQAICAALGAALAVGDPAGALEACQQLVQFEFSGKLADLKAL